MPLHGFRECDGAVGDLAMNSGICMINRWWMHNEPESGDQRSRSVDMRWFTSKDNVTKV
ncbi:putative netrin receptor UNC5D-like [Sesbania bispinosa]|nr:putative netrin receptor UNC5D-like [Sesbania bispinosa]